MSAEPRVSKPDTPPWKIYGLGILLFLFIPVVLFLFVAHPEPVAGSLGLGIVLMIGHRFLARPYMGWVAGRRCLWSGAALAPNEGTEVEIHHRGGVQRARCRESRLWHLERFFTFVSRRRLLLAPGIFLPLLLLLGSLALAAAGRTPPLPLHTVTAIFQLTVGLTVNVAAWGYLSVGRADEPLRIGFPLHNFFLLGIANLLWIFRLVGLWWIYVGLDRLFGG